MKWLTIDYIKSHSRIDYCCEDSLLELYGNSAEQTLLNVLRRSYDDVVEEFGDEENPIPAPLMHASLMLVELSYQFRSPISKTNLYLVPYTFESLIKPYMKLLD